MNVSEATKHRKSVRQFLDKPVAEETVRKLLELAARSPSGGNTQAMEAVMKGGFDAPEFNIYPSAAESKEFLDRRRQLGFKMYELMGIARDDKAGRAEAMLKNYDFFGAPVGLIVTVDRVCDRNGWGHVGMFLQTLCLLACDFGLETCLQEAWSSIHQTIYKQLNIPDSEMLWCGVALGYADWSAKVNDLESEREPVEKFATFINKL
ncbi:Nitroreductase family protein [Hondaea fermentalgiana]|uniref:Nitroreductase family protein n=1 Tax=Hondaea fermentalgiana TaxID=2315210 RepID=A0A2R5GBX2_9STRA|nr:Nitroreductase family protein [Hondaea fermentalgiana]|eukprot:GBG26073.1 Nitroreductase family protein [Hondaea fermentalgiana]